MKEKRVLIPRSNEFVVERGIHLDQGLMDEIELICQEFGFMKIRMIYMGVPMMVCRGDSLGEVKDHFEWAWQIFHSLEHKEIASAQITPPPPDSLPLPLLTPIEFRQEDLDDLLDLGSAVTEIDPSELDIAPLDDWQLVPREPGDGPDLGQDDCP